MSARRAFHHLSSSGTILIALGFSLCALAPLSETARAETPLRWKFKTGDKLQYAVAQRSKVVVTNSGLDFDVVGTQIADLTCTVGNVDADGTAEMKVVFDRIQMQAASPYGGQFQYDSKSGKTGGGQLWEMVNPLFQASLGQEIHVRVSPRGEVSDIKLPEGLSAILTALEPHAVPQLMMGGGINASTYRDMLALTFVRLPAKPVAAKATWKLELPEPIGPVAKRTTELTFTSTGPSMHEGRTLERIDVASQTKVEIDEDNPDFFLEVTSDEMTGSVWFDANAGRAVDLALRQKLELAGDLVGTAFSQVREIETFVRQGSSADLKLPPTEGEKK